MKKVVLTLCITLFCFGIAHAQVGINTTTPDAQLDIKSSNQATPSNTDGLLIPKVDAFPVINPTAAQKGMLVYLTTVSGANQPGFYYWNNPGWVALISGSAGSTLDQAYDFGGAGAGRTITADTGAVTIAGTDGLVSTGTSGSGAVVPSGAGTRMLWNPRKSAFRAGEVGGTEWDDVHLGQFSMAFGSSARASGSSSAAWGANSIALGSRSTTWGFNNNSIGQTATSFGESNIAVNDLGTVWGRTNIARGFLSTAWGVGTEAGSFAETVFGTFPTILPVPFINNLFAYNNADRLFVVGNGFNASSRSDAFVIMKHGGVGIGTSSPATRLHVVGNIRMVDGNQDTGKVLTSDASGTATWQTPATVAETDPQVSSITTGRVPRWNGTTLSDGVLFDDASNIGIGTAFPLDKLHVVGNIRMVDGNQAAGKVFTSDANGTATWQAPAAAGTTLDGAYDFGGAGLGKTITADAGAVTIAGTDGLVSTGAVGSGAIAPSGAGTRMVWNPNKSSFRAGNVTGTEWDNANIGIRSIAFGFGTIASGMNSSAFGSTTVASGGNSSAFGGGAVASGTLSMAFGTATIASGSASTAFGISTTASSDRSTAFGFETISSGNDSVAFGNRNTASAFCSIAAGLYNTAPSAAETVLGIGATVYTPSVNGATQYRAANVTDRLLVVGNAIDANNNFTVDAAERSDALVILKNGNTGIGSSTPQNKLHVVGNIRMVDGNQAAGKIFTSDANGTATWQTPAAAGTTLDGAYDFGGAGVGRTITADTGAVTIAGTDGLVSTGTSGSGAVAPSGAGTRMVWNPNKSAFRAGNVTGTQWDDANIGVHSTAFGVNTIASGTNATALGITTTSSGNGTTAIGFTTTASGDYSLAGGQQNSSSSIGETVLGLGATTYTPSVNGATQFRAANVTDRLLVVGNALDANNNGTMDLAERSDALVILKNGNTGIGSSTPADKLHIVGNIRMVDGNQAAGKILASDANGTATWTGAGTLASGTLDQAYDFGGAGAGATITADAGAITIAGTDGLVSTGTI